MFSLEALKIDLKAMVVDCIDTTYVLDDDYFTALDGADIQQGRVEVGVSIRKTETYFTLSLAVEGFVTVQCDRCLDDMQQQISGESSFIVKLSNEVSEDEEIIHVDEVEGILDPSWLIYETIALSVPIKHVHAPGKCNAAMTEKLNELSATRSGDGAEKTIDPRWAALKGLTIDD